jgi:hypothetical protein
MRNRMNMDPNNMGMMDKSMMFLETFGFVTNSLCEVARYYYRIINYVKGNQEIM